MYIGILRGAYPWRAREALPPRASEYAYPCHPDRLQFAIRNQTHSSPITHHSLLITRYSAFSLLEVLVVVAIIALLVAVLVPTLSKAREQANRTVCASHQKQILTGLYTYVSNSKGWLPYSVPAFNASLTWIVEQSFSKPPYPQGYVHLGLLYKNRQIADPKTFFCPSHHEFPHIYPSGWTDFVAGSKNIEHTATSYIYLLNGQVDAYPKGVMLNARLEQFKGRQSLLTCVFLGNSSKKQTARVWPHKAGVNAAYADGSVQLFNLSTSLGDTAAKLYSSGNIGDMDYFTFCMFKLLSGERKWIDAFPQ